MLIELAKGVSFLLALCFLQSFIARRWRQDERIGQVLFGVLFGCVTIVGMLVPVEVAPGHIADARSALLSIAGLFGGVVGGLVAGVIAGVYRAWLGGGGAPVGVAAVIVFVLLGWGYRYCVQRGWVQIGIWQLLVFGLIVHLAMVCLFQFLPAPAYRMVMDNMALPMVLAFTPATVLLGMLLHWINHQVRTEAALAESERRFKDIAECTSDWIWETDPDLRFTYFSHRDPDALGYDINQVVGARREDNVPQSELDANPEKWAAHFADLEARRPFRNFELVLETKETGQRHIRSSGTPVYAADGSFQGYRGAATDITSEKLAQQALRDSEEHYRDLFEGLDVGILVVANERRIVFANPACAHLFGYDSLEAFLKVKTRDFIAPHDRERVLKHTRDIIGGVYERQSIEFDGLGPDGFYKPIHLSSRRIVWDGERAIMRTLIDLSELKRAEEQLRQAQKMEAVGQLTSGVAHDFNNILTAVTGNLKLALRETGEDSSASGLIRRALDASWRAANLTGRLLTFSRKEALNPQTVDVADLVEEMRDLLCQTVTEQISIEYRIQPNLWMCKVDPNQLESAILNLSINARDAMPDGGILSIAICNEALHADAASSNGAAPGEYVVVAVSDTGTGMTKEVIERASEPFFTSKDVGEGSGLGLSMVHGFVKQSGGYLRIDSTVGEGTTVCLYLPRTEATATAVESPIDFPGLPASSGETILIVEDDPDVRELNVNLLTGLGYTVLEADDGPSAISIAEQNADIDLLFTDIILPGGMKGPELAAEILQRRPEIAVLYTSGYTRDAIPLDGAEGGEFDLLKKPFKIEELAQKVRLSINRSLASEALNADIDRSVGKRDLKRGLGRSV